MSVHKTTARYVVRWREGTRNRQRSFDRRADAQRWDGEVRRRRQLGSLRLLDAGELTLDEYVVETWAPVHGALLAPSTRGCYGRIYDHRIAPRLGGMALHELTPAVVARWQAELLAAGAGVAVVVKARAILSGVLRTAVESELVAANPVRATRRPRSPMRDEVRPLAPASVEALRARLSSRDAVLVSLLAYAGLRPQEARALCWGHVQDKTLIVAAPKTGKRRTVRLLEPLRADLLAWRMANGRPADDRPVIPGHDGREWTQIGFHGWRTTHWLPALERAGLPHARPYDLRHSFASLLLHEGRSVIYVARQLGHSATMTLSVYGHVIDELEDAPRVPAEDSIRAARASVASPNVRATFAS